MESAKPVRLRILLPYPTEEEFILRYGHNVARKGMFVATRSPKAPGTVVAFELVLQGGGPLMRGEGVVERRQPATTQSPRQGMIVRFTRLDEASAELLERVLQAKAERAPEREGAVGMAPADGEPSGSLSQESSAEPWRAALGGRCVLGIDLGGTACRMAAVIDGRAQLLSIDGVGPSLPSLVTVADDGVPRVVVRAPGQEPRDAGSPGHEEVQFIGRWVGRAFGTSPLLPRFAAATEDGALGFSLRGRIFTPEELSAVLFTALKEAAEVQLGRAVGEVVLAVPGTYTEAQRTALVLAAHTAGLRVLGLITATAATTLAFTSDLESQNPEAPGAPTRFLTIDWGGGGLDVAALEVSGRDVRVVAAGGDPFAGGSGLDRHLAEAVLAAWEARQSFTLPRTPAVMDRLVREAERVKIILSEEERSVFRLSDLAVDPNGRSVELYWELDREGMERLLEAPLEHTASIVRELLDDWPGRTFTADEVLLVGAQNRMPALRKRLLGLLGRASWNELDEDGLSARGAALFGEILAGTENENSEATVSRPHEVLSSPIYALPDPSHPPAELRPEKLLEHNTPLPAQRQFKVPSVPGGVRELGLHQISPRVGAPPTLWSVANLLHHPEVASGERLLQLDVDRDGRLVLSIVQENGALEPLLLTHIARPSALPAPAPVTTAPNEPPPLEHPTDSRVTPIPASPSLGGLLRRIFPRKGS